MNSASGESRADPDWSLRNLSSTLNVFRRRRLSRLVKSDHRYNQPFSRSGQKLFDMSIHLCNLQPDWAKITYKSVLVREYYPSQPRRRGEHQKSCDVGSHTAASTTWPNQKSCCKTISITEKCCIISNVKPEINNHVRQERKHILQGKLFSMTECSRSIFEWLTMSYIPSHTLTSEQYRAFFIGMSPTRSYWSDHVLSQIVRQPTSEYCAWSTMTSVTIMRRSVVTCFCFCFWFWFWFSLGRHYQTWYSQPIEAYCIKENFLVTEHASYQSLGPQAGWSVCNDRPYPFLISI